MKKRLSFKELAQHVKDKKSKANAEAIEQIKKKYPPKLRDVLLKYISTSSELKSIEEVLKKALLLGLDEEKFVSSYIWYYKKAKSSNSLFLISLTHYLAPTDIDNKFVERINIGRLWLDKRNSDDPKYKEHKKLYGKEFFSFFKRDAVEFRRGISRNKHTSYRKRNESDWHKNGMIPNDDAPNDWENYRTDEIID